MNGVWSRGVHTVDCETLLRNLPVCLDFWKVRSILHGEIYPALELVNDENVTSHYNTSLGVVVC